MSTRRLVLGTRNSYKVLELRPLLAPLSIEVVALSAFPAAIEVVEDGDTFAANATLKATLQAKHLGQWVLGEDSGVVVPALGGEPGVYSARYAGALATDESNNRLLLEKLAATPPPRRAAYYVCHMTLADPAANVLADCEAHCHGRIAAKPAGGGGFGYDPLFELIEYHRTFGQLGSAVKKLISHRGRAARMMAAHMTRLIEERAW